MKKFLKQKQGVATIEFAMLFGPFFILIGIVIESSILIYQNSLINYVGFNAATYAASASYKEGYEAKFKEYLEKQKSTFLAFADTKRLKLDMVFCRNIVELSTNACTGSQNANQIVIYNLNYQVSPLFVQAWFDKSARYLKSSTIFFSERRDPLFDKEEKQKYEKEQEKRRGNNI